MMMHSDSIIELRNISRFYKDSNRSLMVLDNVNFSLSRGEMVALIAPSGSGKSTLLHLAGLLEKPNDGDVLFFNKSCHNLTDSQRTVIRRDMIGFVYQFHHLLTEFTALENVMIPQMIAGVSQKKAELHALELLHCMRLENRIHHRPGELSGGEQQRVAIARSVANTPLILLADEPTGNLDPDTSAHVFHILRSFLKKTGLSALIATHNYDLASQMDRLALLKNGKLVEVSELNFSSRSKSSRT